MFGRDVIDDRSCDSMEMLCENSCVQRIKLIEERGIVIRRRGQLRCVSIGFVDYRCDALNGEFAFMREHACKEIIDLLQESTFGQFTMNRIKLNRDSFWILAISCSNLYKLSRQYLRSTLYSCTLRTRLLLFKTHRVVLNAIAIKNESKNELNKSASISN